MACLYPRAALGTQWRVLHGASAKRAASLGQAVRIAEPVALESVATGSFLRSDEVIRMNHYGNEWRVFSAPGRGGDAAAEDSGTMWLFVGETWLEALAGPNKLSGEAGLRLDGQGLGCLATEKDKAAQAARTAAVEREINPGEIV